MKLISASAGSGKTARIAKEYIKYILENPANIRLILAITFTNKAAAEMKDRILFFLKGLSGHDEFVSTDDKEMIDDLKKEIRSDKKISERALKLRATEAVNRILYSSYGGGYSDFSVMTIDSFTNRMTKVFAYELNIPPNYALMMNIKNIIRDAVDRVISSAQPGGDLAEIIMEYILYRVEQNENIMIENEIFELSHSLRNMEKSLGTKIKLKDNIKNNPIKTIIECKKFVSKVQNKVYDYCVEIKNKATEFHKTSDIPLSEYSNSTKGYMAYILNYEAEQNEENFRKLILGGRANAVRESAGIDKIRQNTKKKTPQMFTEDAENYLRHILEIITEMQKYMESIIKQYMNSRMILKNIYCNLLYDDINSIIEQYQNDNSIIFIDELNQKISKLFDDTYEVPFIYFRLGERYLRYMIDEFQDTSQLQWQNIEPLAKEATASGGKVITVGDLKQAIYRFRGGSTEVMEKQMKPGADIEYLESNWRSRPNIIALNNSLFPGIISGNDIYSNINVCQTYRQQDKPVFSNEEGTGYFEIGISTEEGRGKKLPGIMLSDENRRGKLHEIIEDLLNRGYKQSSIAILVRNNSEGSLIAEALSGNEIAGQTINILSADTLYIEDNPYVDFIINLLRFSVNSSDIESFFKALYLWREVNDDSTAFRNAEKYALDRVLKNKLKNKEKNKDEKKIIIEYSEMNKVLATLWGQSVYDKYDEEFRSKINQLSVFESISLVLEYIINPLCKEYTQSIPYISRLRDAAYSRMKDDNMLSFLEYYDEYKRELKIPPPAGDEAITISTIHKSKGLAYDVVIIPYGNWKDSKKGLTVYNDPEMAVKYSDIENYSGIETLINDTDVTEMINRIDTKKKEMLFDDVNLLYVAMTRARKELYLFTEHRDKDKKADNDGYNSIERILTRYLESAKSNEITIAEDKSYLMTIYSVGVKPLKDTDKQTEYKKLKGQFTVNNHKEHMFIERKMRNLILKSRGSEEISMGNTIHAALSMIMNINDVPKAVNQMVKEGIIASPEQDKYISILEEIVNSDEFKIMFDSAYEMLNERNIVFENKVIRPDRVLINESEVMIFDYKTGMHDKKYEEKMKKYMSAYIDMGYNPKGYIAYTNDKQLIEVDI